MLRIVSPPADREIGRASRRMHNKRVWRWTTVLFEKIVTLVDGILANRP
jgi:hypothetical protein